MGLPSHDIDLLVEGISVQDFFSRLDQYVLKGGDFAHMQKARSFWPKNPKKLKFSDVMLLVMYDSNMEVTNARTIDPQKVPFSEPVEFFYSPFLFRLRLSELSKKMLIYVTSR